MTNVELVLHLYDLFRERRIDDHRKHLAPDVYWIEYIAAPYGSTFIGRAAVRENVLDRFLHEWEDFEITPDEIVDGGSYVVVVGNLRGTLKATGKTLHLPFCHVWRVRYGQVVQFRHFTDASLMDQVL